MKNRLILAIILILSLVGCANVDKQILEDDPATKLCLLEREEGHELVIFYTCQSDAKELVEANCSVDVIDNTLEVTSSFEYEVGEVARGLCHRHQITCPVSSLPDGEYILHHGESEHNFTLPSDTNLDCASYEESSFE